MLKQAKDLDNKWAAKQESAKAKRTREAVTDKKHSTGVRGINIVFRPSPAFRVQVQVNGKSKVREFSVRKLGDAKAWNEATKYRRPVVDIRVRQKRGEIIFRRCLKNLAKEVNHSIKVES